MTSPPITLHRPCAVCGSPHAPFGVGVSLRRDQPGLWYCRDHRPAPPARLKAPEPAAARPPRQASLL